MENLVNETRNESRKKTNVTSLIAFFSFYVVAIFLLTINSRSNDSSSILPQEYFWLPQNLIYTLFANGFLCLFLLIFKNSGKTLVWCIYTIPLMILSLNIVVMGFIILENSTYHAEPLWFSFFLLTVIAIVFGLLLYKYRVNINLVTDIIGESIKGVDGVKFLVLIPIVNSLLLLIPMNVYYSAYESIKDEDYSFTVIWITAAFILFLFFMDEFQKFLVAGVTTKCYFIRDQNNFGQPILETLTLIKFHLGSVCYGAMIKFFRPFLRFMSYISKTLNLTNSTTIISITNWFDAHTVSNSAYVLISRDGIPYYESGKKLYILHSKDLINGNKINNTKNTTIFIVKFFLWSLIATVQALIIEHNQNFQKWTDSNVEVFITLVYIFCMVSIYIDYIETITDATIITACLDIETNNGTTKPYYMTKSLEDFIRRLRLEDEPQVIISGRLNPPQLIEVPQTTIISTIYSPYQQNSQQNRNIVYLPDFSNQVRDELIPVQNYQPSAPQFD